MKRIHKFATGDKVPKGAIYLNTLRQTKSLHGGSEWGDCWYVWHYFLVEVEE
ncbi:hypothetical protein LCGC14_0546040 [marine sediment metagenome]|uniref:Uncharacterized protein n=1 Tax=marine sediment metagenome TaxID=412755 RepID=A0A0F9RW46_9ZZZZ